MAEYIEREALVDDVERTTWYHISLQGNLAEGARSDIHTPLYKADDVYAVIDKQPTVDAVEVVRCEKCLFSRELNRESEFENQFPEECVFCMEFIEAMPRDGFCYRGERKDGAKNG